MIDARELRIGNWVLTKDGIPVQVLSYFDKSIRNEIYTTSNTDFKYEEDDCDGIRLTPEILEKCGFYKGEHPMAGEIHIIDIQKSAHRTLFITHDPSPLAVLCEEKNGEIATEFVNYLHEVQNLYFALTKKELNVQL